MEDEAVAYLRKSYYIGKKKTDEELVAYQDLTISKFAINNKMKIKEKFSDINYTGKNVDRPALQELLNYLRQHKVKIVLFYSVDRLGRNNLNNIDLIEKIRDCVDKIIFVRDGLTLEQDSKVLKALFLMLSGQAEEANKNLSYKIIDSNDTKLQEKLYIGSLPPIGFTRREDGWLVAATEENTNNLAEMEGYQILQVIFYCYLLGFSYNSIALILNQHSF